MNGEPLKKIFGMPAIVPWLVLLLLFHAVNNLVILSRDNTPLLWDGGDYFYRSLRYFDVFASPDSGFVARFNEVSPYRPPLFLLSSLPFYALFGRTTDVAAMTNLLYLVILVLSVYGIGKRIHSEAAGLLAAALTSTFPILFGMSRSYWLDFPLTAMVSLSMYLLLRADCFRDRRYSWFFGLSAGLGMLTKWTYFVFVAGPFLYFFITSFKANRNQDEISARPTINVTVSLLIGAVVASFWYVPNGLNVAGKLFGLAVGMTGDEATRFQQLGETIGPAGIFNARSLAYYLGQLVNHQITFFTSILFAVFAYLALKRDSKRMLWLFLWIAIPIIAFTLIKNKTPRNTVPMLPAVGLVIAQGIMSIGEQRLRRRLIALTAGVVFFQYVVTSYGAPFLPAKIGKQTRLGEVILFQKHENASFGLYRANKGNWKADEILAAIEATSGGRKDVRILLLPRDAFTWMAMQYTSYLKRMPFTFIGAVDSPESVLKADYVLLKKGGFMAPWFLMQNIHRSIDLLEDRIADFTLIKSVTLPEERQSLPIFDLSENRRSRESGLAFSGIIQILRTSVAESRQESGREFTVEMTLKSLVDLDRDLMVLLHFQNKRLETLYGQRTEMDPPIFGWKAGEVHEVRAIVVVPERVAAEIFSLEMGFFDLSSSAMLTYQPEYLIYRRTIAPRVE